MLIRIRCLNEIDAKRIITLMFNLTPEKSEQALQFKSILKSKSTDDSFDRDLQSYQDNSDIPSVSSVILSYHTFKKPFEFYMKVDNIETGLQIQQVFDNLHGKMLYGLCHLLFPSIQF